MSQIFKILFQTGDIIRNIRTFTLMIAPPIMDSMLNRVKEMLLIISEFARVSAGKKGNWLL